MSNTRRDGLEFLRARLGEVHSDYVKVSKYYPSDESWTKSPVWWFDIPLSKLYGLNHEQVYLLCRKKNSQSFDCLHIPIRYILKNLRWLKLINKKDAEIVRLHLSAREDDRFVDLRGRRRVNFGEWLQG